MCVSWCRQVASGPACHLRLENLNELVGNMLLSVEQRAEERVSEEGMGEVERGGKDRGPRQGS